MITIDQGTYRITSKTTTSSFTKTNITSVTGFINWRKNNMFITTHNTCRFTHSFRTNRLTRGGNIVTAMCFTLIAYIYHKCYTFMSMNWWI